MSTGSRRSRAYASRRLPTYVDDSSDGEDIASEDGNKGSNKCSSGAVSQLGLDAAGEELIAAATAARSDAAAAALPPVSPQKKAAIRAAARAVGATVSAETDEDVEPDEDAGEQD